MPIDIKLPELGDGIESGDILDVLVSEGDQIQKDQGIIEIETDKATVEVPASHAGQVTKVLVASGQTVNIGAPLLTIEPAGSATNSPPPAAQPKTAPAPAVAPPTPAEPPATATPEPSPVEAPSANASPDAAPPATADPAPPAPTPAPAPAQRPPTPVPVTSDTTAPIAAGPAIRRFAREVGVDLGTVQGSGQGGRITRDDVLAVVRHVSQTVANGQGDTAPKEHTGFDVPGESGQDDWGPVSIESAARIRKAIAQQMSQSWSTVPRVTNFDDADVTELEQMRQASKSDYADRGIKLTSMPFLIKSVSMALRNHPLVNASYDPENGQITYKKYVNTGIAVDTPRGLVVPALRDTDDKSIAEIAKELATMAEKVRSNDFSIDDLRGGTFTISNLGAIGGTYSTPIVNVPEVAILLVGRSRKLPVVVGDEIAVRLMMPLSLSYDHRLVDGATAARFLNEVIGYLEAPGRLLLAP